ncbi:sensor histidine kinase [Pelodictyon luteolum]|uniref:histidine kinase n=1 Tax=Chlorobium luteolum (strain DSM 273 / BCRC 81028 / 2530) TaxID=319225 RepID=Q3B3X1_CHLL3|nr:sensor histidine kinase [Pelodictyon luteolum]ABB23960.1 periplasmic sensor signal transduction histidine kinase [Pelodictyon luteolum DSM 273]
MLSGDEASAREHGTDSSFSLAGHMEQYVDETGQLTLTKALQPAIQSKFTHIAGHLNTGHIDHPVWLKATVRTEDGFPRHTILSIGPPSLERLRVYVQTGNDPSSPASYREYRLGADIPASQRTLLTPQFAVPLVLDNVRPTTILIRVEPGIAISLFATILTPEDLYGQTNMLLLLQGAYLGIILITALFSIFNFYRLNESPYLYFGLFVLCIFCFILSGEGILVLALPQQAHLVTEFIRRTAMALSFVFLALFGRSIQRARSHPFASRYLLFISILSGITALSAPFWLYKDLATASMIGALGMMMILIHISSILVMEREPGSKMYLAAFVIIQAGYVLQLLRHFGVVPLEWWSSNPMPFFFLLAIILISFALTERLRESRLAAEEMSIELRNNRDVLEKSLAVQENMGARKKRLIDMISHEYRTPIAIIRANIDIMMLNEASQSKEAASRFCKINRAIQRLVEIMDISLEESQHDDPRDTRNPQSMRIDEFLSQEYVAEITSRFNLSARMSESIGNHCIKADAAQLKTALFNLLDNAGKYSVPGSRILLECSVEQSWMVMRLRNRVEECFIREGDELFEQYRRGRNSTNTAGAGLGLWRVRRIVEHHHGRVAIERNTEEFIATLRIPVILTSE